ncbi:MAG: hypothetical protein MRJ52_02650 [Nitrosomonas sp.]|nr:hypothetical protein [Nitrosomonas sp.]
MQPDSNKKVSGKPGPIHFHFYNENRKHQTLMATPDQVYYESVRLQKAG